MPKQSTQSRHAGSATTTVSPAAPGRPAKDARKAKTKSGAKGKSQALEARKARRRPSGRAVIGELKRYSAPNARGSQQYKARLDRFVRQVAQRSGLFAANASPIISTDLHETLSDALNTYLGRILSHAAPIMRSRKKLTLDAHDVAEGIQAVRGQNIGPQWDESTFNFAIDRK
jgi:histone H3/H4